jgi:hypothetical protein
METTNEKEFIDTNAIVESEDLIEKPLEALQNEGKAQDENLQE